MKFSSIDDLVSFENSLEWKKEEEVVLSNYKAGKDVSAKYSRIKGDKYFGIVGDRIVTVVSEQFTPISVAEIVNACESEFGTDFTEKSYREGIVRVYDTGLENSIGRVNPLVVFPANLGSMAVKLGVYHDAFVCSNGLIVTHGGVGEKIIHRLNSADLKDKIRKVSNDLGVVLNSVETAQEIVLDEGTQLAMIIQALGKTDNLIIKALSKYYPEGNSLWDTIQCITYVSTHETRKGYEYSRKAGEYLVNRSIEPFEIVEAASYAFRKKEKGQELENSQGLFELASEILV
ncbi:MAG: hypothetical protein JW791_05160 [Nanoarchaeota archaeon]|nr:hypothetical protein [Nanoarchaeota archaeon]